MVLGIFQNLVYINEKGPHNNFIYSGDINKYFVFLFIPWAYNTFKSFLQEDFYATNRIKYDIKTENYTFVYSKKSDSKFLKITDSFGQFVNLNISSVDESTIKNALFYDWSLVTSSNGEDTYIPSKNYCNYLEINVNVIPGMENLNDNYIKNGSTIYVTEPLRCLAKLPGDSIININDHFLTDELI